MRVPYPKDKRSDWFVLAGQSPRARIDYGHTAPQFLLRRDELFGVMGCERKNHGTIAT
jgi:hypothetical protein